MYSWSSLLKVFVFKGSPLTAAGLGSCLNFAQLAKIQTGAKSAAVKGDPLKTNTFNLMPSYNYFVTPSPEILDFLGALGVGFSATLIESVSSVPYTFWRPQSCIKEFIVNPTYFTVVVSILSFYEENKIEVICYPI